MNNPLFDKLRARRSVLKRTAKRPQLPPLILYLEWLGGTGQRRFLAEDGQEHVLDDKTVQSSYKLVPGKDSKALIEKHWPEARAEGGDGATEDASVE